MNLSERESHYRADIQGLRAVAVILVVVYHAELGIPGGFIGVDMFFTISGYVITMLILRELNGDASFSYRNFYLRRARRLVPALAVMITVILVGGLFLGPIGGHERSTRTALASAIANANSYLWLRDESGYFGTPAKNNLFLHTWSLSVEEQFYFVFPVVLVISWKLARRVFEGNHQRRITLAIFSALTIGSLVLSEIVLMRADEPGTFLWRTAFYSMPTRAWEFTAGAVLALGLMEHQKKSNSMMRWQAILATGLVASCAIWFDDETRFPGFFAIPPVMATLLVISVGSHSPKSFLSSTLGWRPLQHIGDLSYGWYLWHWPILVMARATFGPSKAVAITGVGVSYLVARLSYHAIEQRFRLRESPRPPLKRGLLPAFLMMPLIVALPLDRYGSEVLGALSPESSQHHLDVRMNCASEVPLNQRPANQCVFGADNAVGEVILVGDSNAGHLTEGVLLAARRDRNNFRVVTRSGCPFSRVMVEDPEAKDCREWVEGAVGWIVTSDAKHVVVSFAIDYAMNMSWYSASGQSSNSSTNEQSRRARALAEGFGVLARELKRAGKDVIFVMPPPKLAGNYRAWRTESMSVVGLRFPNSTMNWQVLRRSAEEIQYAARREIEALSKNGDFTIVNISDDVCGPTMCSAYVDGEWMYRDAGHISVTLSKRLAHRFDFS